MREIGAVGAVAQRLVDIHLGLDLVNTDLGMKNCLNNFILEFQKLFFMLFFYSLGFNCGSGSTQTDTCSVPGCPVNGGWSNWGSWGSCTKTCGTGTRTSYRSCNNPTPRHGGSNCAGSSSKRLNCATNYCPGK